MPRGSQPETGSCARPMARTIDPSARRVLISTNPRAGSRCRRDRVDSIHTTLSAAGYDVQSTGDLGELASLAESGWHSGELRAVLAVGGDGTASVVRNRVPLEIPLLAVPMGTENLLARYTSQRSDPAAVLRTVAEGVSIGLDLGRANGKHFLLMISAGFDAEVVRSLHENRGGNIRRTAYLMPALQTLRRYRYPEMRLYSENGCAMGDVAHRCRWLFGFNLPTYALGLPITPAAVATDGLLDLCAFERGTTWSVVRYLWHVKRRRHHSLADTAMSQVRRFRLDAADAESVAYQLDGDHGGVLPVDVEVLPGQLELLVTPETAVKLGFDLPHAAR